jgi:hydroxymethylglutaryl-CoA reductase
MDQHDYIKGFSKLNVDEKIKLIAEHQDNNLEDFSAIYQFRLKDKETQARLEEISENVVTNYFLPFSIAPNFKINNRVYFVPMVIEESSVVAAASAAAKFWFNRGGFKAKVISTTKIGQVHFKWNGKSTSLFRRFDEIRLILHESAAPLLENMKKRNGGITGIDLLDFSDKIPSYYQIRVSFETADAMGANIINSVLEEMAKSLKQYIIDNFSGDESDCEIVMAILSNHTPDSIVECSVECAIDELAEISEDLSPQEYAQKFKTAVDIANIDVYRATTHNKGIYNGIDAVVLATGNDFRAVEACGHSYASRDGHYRSLTTVEFNDNLFKYTLRVPMALGTVGGLTSTHPLAKLSLEILGNPSAKQLMEITAAAGLANTFSAVRALTTSGIQKGHMRFHLNNILSSLNASNEQKERATEFFKNKKVSHKAVQDFLAI